MYDNVYLTPFGRKLIIDLIQLIGSTRRSIREFKLHVYGKRQTSDSSWEFLKMENVSLMAEASFPGKSAVARCLYRITMVDLLASAILIYTFIASTLKRLRKFLWIKNCVKIVIYV